MRLEPNHIYVIPPNANLAVLHGRLSLMPRTKRRGLNLPVDFFFRSLAADLKGRAIDVILSGTASDGTEGLRAIKAEGGLTIAQDEKTAKYDGMPHSAIAAGVVDCVLPPQGIARELARLGQRAGDREGACGCVSGGHRRGRDGGAAAAVLRQARRRLPNQQGRARPVRLCAAGCDEGSAVLEARPD